MGKHENYGKKILSLAAGIDYRNEGECIKVYYGTCNYARIDGTIADEIAVEIESRTSKQVRGALIDLLFHKFKRKLLLILPVHMNNPDITAEQCRFILSKFLDEKNYEVVVLKGHGNHDKTDSDKKIVVKALKKLGYYNSKKEIM
ncbi:MAG: hypothetical protein Q7J16_05735 [Candidatus Cloacimonadales bacterium]|nr:hypothetical protein [Candidatus Cloacimonadales bacterium]